MPVTAAEVREGMRRLGCLSRQIPSGTELAKGEATMRSHMAQLGSKCPGGRAWDSILVKNPSVLGCRYARDKPAPVDT